MIDVLECFSEYYFSSENRFRWTIQSVEFHFSVRREVVVMNFDYLIIIIFFDFWYYDCRERER